MKYKKFFLLEYFIFAEDIGIRVMFLNQIKFYASKIMCG